MQLFLLVHKQFEKFTAVLGNLAVRERIGDVHDMVIHGANTGNLLDGSFVRGSDSSARMDRQTNQLGSTAVGGKVGNIPFVRGQKLHNAHQPRRHWAHSRPGRQKGDTARSARNRVSRPVRLQARHGAPSDHRSTPEGYAHGPPRLEECCRGRSDRAPSTAENRHAFRIALAEDAPLPIAVNWHVKRHVPCTLVSKLAIAGSLRPKLPKKGHE